MQARLYKNIDLVQINIKSGVAEYQFPKNVAWADRKIDHLLICAPTANIVSPIDGQTHVLRRNEIEDLYIDLYRGDDSELAHNLHFTSLLHTNNHPLAIDSRLSISLSRLFFTTEPTANGCLLVYVVYGSRDVEDLEPSRKNVTIEFPLQAGQKLTFTDIINTYVHVIGKKIRGIQVWEAESNPAYLTLRDHQLTYYINSMYTAMARPQMGAQTVEEQQVHPMLLDSIDIDFDYSFIRNASDVANIQKITIEY